MQTADEYHLLSAVKLLLTVKIMKLEETSIDRQRNMAEAANAFPLSACPGLPHWFVIRPPSLSLPTTSLPPLPLRTSHCFNPAFASRFTRHIQTFHFLVIKFTQPLLASVPNDQLPVRLSRKIHSVMRIKKNFSN